MRPQVRSTCFGDTLSLGVDGVDQLEHVPSPGSDPALQAKKRLARLRDPNFTGVTSCDALSGQTELKA